MTYLLNHLNYIWDKYDKFLYFLFIMKILMKILDSKPHRIYVVLEAFKQFIL